jgi:hypothetical protein
MDKQTKYLLYTLAAVIGVLYVFKPKVSLDNESSEKEDKYAAPSKVSNAEQEMQHNAMVSIKAMRDAINGGEKQRDLDKLNTMLLNENGIKVYTDDKGGLIARDRAGRTIAKE